MTYVLKAIPKGNYLHVTVEGDNNPQNVTNYLSEVRDVCLQHRCRRVLVEENLRGPSIGTLNIFDVVSNASADAVQAGLQVAFVDTNKEHETSAMRFAETVARNRGVNVRQFSDVGNAEQWLLNNEATE